jgi:hypothetical protein
MARALSSFAQLLNGVAKTLLLVNEERFVGDMLLAKGPRFWPGFRAFVYHNVLLSWR